MPSQPLIGRNLSRRIDRDPNRVLVLDHVEGI
jgi:hypothetical protein